MIKLSEEIYKNITIIYEICNDKSNKGLFYASTNFLHSHNCKTFEEAETTIKKMIDDFLEDVPKNYEELARKIENSLIWTSYETCYINPKYLKIILSSFIKLQKDKLDE
jgi:hypothetical protein